MNLSMIILLPLLGFMINGFLSLYGEKFKYKPSAKNSGMIASFFMATSFIVSLFYLNEFKAASEENWIIKETLFSWIRFGGFNLDFTLCLDSLSLVFSLIITGVGTLIHIYSIGYMESDKSPAKYFAYLNLFCFMMLNLVLGGSMPHVFLGWEGVGLASYLLIGYWNEDQSKVLAGQKAFIMNRIGDVGFLIAMFIAYKYVGSLDFQDILNSSMRQEIITLFCGLVFFACTGKSAQIPLFTWLPDAMAGPTPVSALIHAATMVTSGVYLLNRISPLMLQSPQILYVVGMVGAVTAFVSALIACAQKDIKKILAYSTVSQLGFMFIACGVGAFDVAVYHVMTHAFFKALLFLGAGSVIHALHEEQNVFKMGGLMKKLPITATTFILGWAAIIGIPPFSGFFSKDEILIEALNSQYGNRVLFTMAMASAFLTAFYMTRLLVLVFIAKPKVSSERDTHESPWIMTVPLMILSGLSAFGGWLYHPTVEKHENSTSIMITSVIVALIAAGFSFYRYGKLKTEEIVNPVMEKGFGIDYFYERFFGGGVHSISRLFNKWIEQNLIQGGLKFCSWAVQLSGNVLKSFQVGSVQTYLLMILLLGVGIMIWILKDLLNGVFVYGN